MTEIDLKYLESEINCLQCAYSFSCRPVYDGVSPACCRLLLKAQQWSERLPKRCHERAWWPDTRPDRPGRLSFTSHPVGRGAQRETDRKKTFQNLMDFSGSRKKKAEAL